VRWYQFTTSTVVENAQYELGECTRCVVDVTKDDSEAVR
jgi:hypothetical protein